MTCNFIEFTNTDQLIEFIKNSEFSNLRIPSHIRELKLHMLYDDALIYFKDPESYSKNPTLYLDFADTLFDFTSQMIVDQIDNPRHIIFNVINDVVIELLHNTKHDARIINLINNTDINVDPIKFLPKCINALDAKSYFAGYCGGGFEIDSALLSFMGPEIYSTLTDSVKEGVFESLYDYAKLYSGDRRTYVDNVFQLYTQLDLSKIDLQSEFVYKIISLMYEFEQNSAETNIYCEFQEFINDVKTMGTAVYGTSFKSLSEIGVSLNCAHDYQFWKMAHLKSIGVSPDNDCTLPELV